MRPKFNRELPLLNRLSRESWAQLALAWEEECNEYEEDFSDYAIASLPVLEDLACGPPLRDAAVFSFKEAGKVDAIFQANVTFLPGYDGKVLRIRHIVLAPGFDFGDFDIDQYATAITGVFSGAVGLAYEGMPADHIKFHLKSPAERAFGESFTNAVQNHEAFKKVVMKGSWIYLSKA